MKNYIAALIILLTSHSAITAAGHPIYRGFDLPTATKTTRSESEESITCPEQEFAPQEIKGVYIFDKSTVIDNPTPEIEKARREDRSEVDTESRVRLERLYTIRNLLIVQKRDTTCIDQKIGELSNKK